MKSHENILLEVAASIYNDAVVRCAAKESTRRDIDLLMSRVKHEGLSFLTITLPSFGQDFERCLDLGYVDSKYFRSFRKYRQIPAFLRGIVSQVFDVDTGKILNEPCIEAVECVRQLAYTFKKLRIPCTPERDRKAFTGFVRDELDLCEPLAPEDVSHFENVCDYVWGWMGGDPYLDPLSSVPKHGPGATAEGIRNNQKYIFRSWHDRLEPYFPVTSTAIASLSAVDSQVFKSITILSEEQELPVKVITVPKTLKSPRIIAIEPVCMQYAQQALCKTLVRRLESHFMTSGHVNFTRQDINQRLAMTSSRTNEYATLDLSSASDRVPRSLALRMFQWNPDFQDAVDACRSKNAKLPDGNVISLKKFASMGSALCFPVESMYFYTICIAARLKIHNLPVTRRNVFNVSRHVYVYGDDILVPTNEAAVIVDYLQKYYCKVNMTKSFWNGNFRESCGMDAFLGKSVTPTYLRELHPDDKHDADKIISWVKTASLFEERGFLHTSNLLYQKIESMIGLLPVVGPDFAGLGRTTPWLPLTKHRWNPKVQRSEVRALVPSPVFKTDKLDGYPALLKCFLNMEHRGSSSLDTMHPLNGNKDHLNITARYGAVTLKRRWVVV